MARQLRLLEHDGGEKFRLRLKNFTDCAEMILFVKSSIRADFIQEPNTVSPDITISLDIVSWIDKNRSALSEMTQYTRRPWVQVDNFVEAIMELIVIMMPQTHLTGWTGLE